MTPTATESVRDVMALVTAIIAGDEDASFLVIEQTDDPRAVLAGLAGFVELLLPGYAQAEGISDLAGEWATSAAEAGMRLARGLEL